MCVCMYKVDYYKNNQIRIFFLCLFLFHNRFRLHRHSFVRATLKGLIQRDKTSGSVYFERNCRKDHFTAVRLLLLTIIKVETEVLYIEDIKSMDKGILERQCKMFGSNIGSSSVSIEELRIKIVCNI